MLITLAKMLVISLLDNSSRQLGACGRFHSADTHGARGGLELPRPYEHSHLKPARLPFRHSREQ